MNDKKTLAMVFDNQESLDLFVSFMDRYGEQIYWNWMECADEEGNKTVRFNYWPDGIKEGGHHANNTILCPLKEKE
jgi:hypothetical protein